MQISILSEANEHLTENTFISAVVSRRYYVSCLLFSPLMVVLAGSYLDHLKNHYIM